MNSVIQANLNLKLEHSLSIKYTFHEPTVQVLKQKVSPTLSVHKTYPTQVKKKHLHNILNNISEAKMILAWKLARISKAKESVVIPSKKTTKPVIPSMFFNPFKLKTRRLCETQNVD